jgi:hypothetical protein
MQTVSLNTLDPQTKTAGNKKEGYSKLFGKMRIGGIKCFIHSPDPSEGQVSNKRPVRI